MLRRCDHCKLTKSRDQFFRYKCCKKCHIKHYINLQLLYVRIANHFNVSISELKNMLQNDFQISYSYSMDDRQKYEQLVNLFKDLSMRQSTVITETTIEHFLNEDFLD